MTGMEQNIVNQAKRLGQPIPDGIANAPRLNLGLELYLQAFYDLDSERTIGLSLSPIPWSAIHNYCECNLLGEEQTENMHYFIRRMDGANLKRMNEKSKAQENGKNPPRPRRKV